ncbi:MAG: type II toxin-antitoxin system RelE/ParE family toxin, partial [Lachnospiraceae bacterium]|nr:type II toxin-antitoxin system RelE/ParE family toxin [Lachnospiraceae bacterium]
MRHYKVKLRPKALLQLNDIYKYVSDRKRKLIKKAILDLDTMPRRGTIRQQGVYATGEYRQSIVEEFIVIYRI